MAMLPSSFVVLCVIFISFVISGLHVVKGDTCQKDIGICAKYCTERCGTFFKGGQGQCDSNNHCVCTYDCGAGEGDVCNGTGGICSRACDDHCCTENCAEKYKKWGMGFCNDAIPGVPLCYCEYKC